MKYTRALRTTHVIYPVFPVYQPRQLRRLPFRPSVTSFPEPLLTRRSQRSVSNSTKIRPASCLCKAVQYEATGEPFHYILCHCSNCKKSAGSAFMTHSLWKPDQLKITKGESFIRHYSDSDTQSGNTLTRSFCTNCGSPLFVKTTKDDFIIAQPSAIEGHQSWVPTKDVFPDGKAEWLKDIAFLPKKPKL